MSSVLCPVLVVSLALVGRVLCVVTVRITDSLKSTMRTYRSLSLHSFIVLYLISAASSSSVNQGREIPWGELGLSVG